MNFKEAIIEFKPYNIQEENDKRIILDFIKKNDVLTRKNEIAHMTSSSIILNKSLDKMLMIYHKIYDTWTWTGGHADGDIDMLKVAIKEAKEETGLSNLIPVTDKILSVDILPVKGHMKNDKYVSAHLHLNTSYGLIADEDDILTLNSVETSGVKWFEIDEFDQFVDEPDFIKVYKKIIERIIKVKKNDEH